jgi:heterodisulfide reductase subunit A
MTAPAPQDKGATTSGQDKTKAAASAPRIGVFVCHCGSNIAGVVDCGKVREAAEKLPGVVVAKENKYTCSDLGQEEIIKAIKEHGIERVVVASCSPRLHEPTFRKCVQQAGLNPYLLHMVNIREQCSWVHSHEKDRATGKASDLIRMGVSKASRLEPLEAREVPVEPTSLVIGGGVAGIQAALDLGNMGFKVYLVESQPSIGGKMAQLDKTFPTGDCAICILAPKMVELSRHPNITLLSYSEVEEVKGYIGNYDVKVRRKARYVHEGKCIGCGACADACPVKVKNEFDLGFGQRKAVYVPFPQAVPLKYTIDKENCLYFKTGKCLLCVKACSNQAIDHKMQDEILNLKIGTIIVATGYDSYVPKKNGVYRYWEFDNVITALELEKPRRESHSSSASDPGTRSWESNIAPAFAACTRSRTPRSSRSTSRTPISPCTTTTSERSARDSRSCTTGSGKSTRSSSSEEDPRNSPRTPRRRASRSGPRRPCSAR